MGRVIKVLEFISFALATAAYFWFTVVKPPKVKIADVNERKRLRSALRLPEWKRGLWIKWVLRYRDLILVDAELDWIGRVHVLLHELGHHLLRFFPKAAHQWWNDKGWPLLMLPLTLLLGVARSVQVRKDVLREAWESYLEEKS